MDGAGCEDGQRQSAQNALKSLVERKEYELKGLRALLDALPDVLLDNLSKDAEEALWQLVAGFNQR